MRTTRLTLAPGDRADVVVDFQLAFPAERFVFKNDAFPMMQFRVATGNVEDPVRRPHSRRGRSQQTRRGNRRSRFAK